MSIEKNEEGGGGGDLFQSLVTSLDGAVKDKFCRMTGSVS